MNGHAIEPATATDTQEVTVTPAVASGFMAFSRTMAGSGWNLVHPDSSVQRDWLRCPYPFFPTREDAAHAIKKSLPCGGDGRVVFVQL